MDITAKDVSLPKCVREGKIRKSIMNISRFDLMYLFSGYSCKHTTTHKQGHEITYQAIDIDDIVQSLDEIMDVTRLFWFYF